MNRRDAVLALLVLSAEPLGVSAQQSPRAYRVGTLSLSHDRGAHHAVFEKAMLERGWATGRNIVFDYRFAGGRSDRLPALAAELVHLQTDVIVADLGTTSAAIKATSRIPIVMRFGLDAVEMGLVGTLGRPANNVTGLSGDVTAEIMAKRLELLRETVPTARRLAVLMHSFPGVEVWRKELEDGARKLGFVVQIVEVQTPEDLSAAFAAIRRGKADALFCGGDAVTFPVRAKIAQFALNAKLPGVYGPREWAEAGGLLSYGVNISDLYRESAHYADMILRGAKPAELPIRRPTKYDLLVNLATAKTLNLSIPKSVLLRADTVLE